MQTFSLLAPLIFICLFGPAATLGAVKQELTTVPPKTLGAEAGLKVEHFVIRPLNCVAQYKGQECRMAITLEWRTNEPTDLCFYQGEKQLACWQNTQDVAQTLEIKLQQDSQFELKYMSSNVTLQRQVVKITFLNKYRRTLRPQWSIF